MKETGIESSISDVDAKNYVKEVIVEIQKAEKENHLLTNNSTAVEQS